MNLLKLVIIIGLLILCLPSIAVVSLLSGPIWIFCFVFSKSRRDKFLKVLLNLYRKLRTQFKNYTAIDLDKIKIEKLYLISFVTIVIALLSPIGDRLQVVFDKIVLPYLDYSSNIWLTILAILFLFLAVLHNYDRYKSKSLLSDNWIFLLCVLDVTLILYYFKGSYSYALLYEKVPFLSYVFCFFFISNFYLFTALFNMYKALSVKEDTKSTPILNPGKPINQDGIVDGYSYKEYIESIAPIIIANFDKDISVSLGISGAWGSGKTSFLHALRIKIKDDIIEKGKKSKNEKRVLIEFKPWFCEKKTDLVQEFFKVYREYMGSRISGFDSDIMEYAKVLTENVDKLKWVNLVMKLCTPVESIQKQFGAITKKLKRYEIPVYIIIDDLDRLDGEEIMEILRLIRITANFPYTQFILAYDKPYIQKAIKKQLDYDDSERFIDKVINTEICLPHFDNYRIGNLLYDELAEYCDEVNDIRAELLNWNPMLGENNESSFATIIPKLLRTFRDVHRFVNMFKLDFDKMNGDNEVDFRDFFMLSLIKYTYPDFYRRMSVEPLQIFDIKSNELLLKNDVLDSGLLKSILQDIFMSDRYSETIDGQDKMLIRNKQLFMNNRSNYNKYFQLKTPTYQYNMIDFLNAVEDQRLDYIKRKESVIKGYELERILSFVFTNYNEAKNSEGLNKLISFTDQLLEYNANYVTEVNAAFLSYLKLLNSFNEEIYLQILAVLVKHDIYKDNNNQWGEMLSFIIMKRSDLDIYSDYVLKIKEILESLDSINSIRSLSEVLVRSKSNEGLISNEQIIKVQAKILNNILNSSFDLPYKFEAYKAMKYYDSEIGSQINRLYEDYKDVVRKYAINHSRDYINFFIKQENIEDSFYIKLYPREHINILTRTDIDAIFEQEKNNDVPNYYNALKFWNWIKKTRKDYYQYVDPTQTKTVDQWIAEGMPGLE